MELIDLQYSDFIKNKFNEILLIDFYQKCVLSQQYPELKKQAAWLNSLFGSTYFYKQLFSRMKSKN